MTPQFLEFKAVLVNGVVAKLKTVTVPDGMIARLGDSFDNPDSDSEFLIYFGPTDVNVGSVGDPDWVGRYVAVNPNDSDSTKPYLISFMESVKNVERDFGPTIGINRYGPIVADMIVDYLITGAVPPQAITAQ